MDIAHLVERKILFIAENILEVLSDETITILFKVSLKKSWMLWVVK